MAHDQRRGTIPAKRYTRLVADPVPAQRLERAAIALTGKSFAVDLYLSRIEEDINKSGRYDSLKSWSPGSPAAALAGGSQLAGDAGTAARAIWVIGAEGGARPTHCAATHRRSLPSRGCCRTVLPLRETAGFCSRQGLPV
jgi:hypothetical protein